MKLNRIYYLLLCIVLSSMVQTVGAKPTAPIAMAKPDSVTVHQMSLIDDWKWLQDRNDPELRKVLKREAVYAKQAMKPSLKLEKSLYREYISAISDSESSYPRKDHGYYYYSRTEKGKAYSIHYRKKDEANAKAEIVMDENQLAKGKPFFAIGCYVISPDQKTLAYSVDYSGDEVYTLFIKTLSTGQVKATGITNISDLVWQSDNLHAIITTENDRMQTDKCFRLNTVTNIVTELYTEQDPGYDVSVYKSTDDSYIFAVSSSKDASEAQFIAADDVIGSFKMILARRVGHTYYPDYIHDRLYLQTNFWNQDYSVADCAITDTNIDNWREIYPAKSGSPIVSYLVFDNYIVLQRREQGVHQFEIYDRQTADLLQTIQPQSMTTLSFWFNPDPSAKGFTYTQENDLEPYSIYYWDFAKSESKLLYRDPIATQLDLKKYKSSISYVKVAEGVLIPVQLVYRADLDFSKVHPLWLSGYGAYGDCNDSYFSSLRLPMLDRGVIYAVAHVRGGGEYGQMWHDMGRKLNKKNSFTDFVACMDYLLESGTTDRDHLIIEGGSAGGLLMGAVTNLAKDKCRLVIADVPFVDIANTMLDESLPLTIQEYEEWGDPRNPEVFRYILSYSPYNNVTRAEYPEMLITTAWKDTRVGYWEALKWAQMLRTNNLGTSHIVLRMLWNEGHTGSTDRFQSIRTYAQTVAYALYCVGITE